MSIPAASATSTSVSFDLLGPLRVTVAGDAVRLGGPRQVAVLARLLLSPGLVVSMDQLSESIWDGDSPARPEVAIRSYISNLRRGIEPDRPAGDRHSCIENVPPGYRLLVAPSQIDAHRFEDLVKMARRHLGDGNREDAVAALDRARALWRGEPCEGVLETDAVLAFRSRLTELRQVAAELWFEARLGLGEHETVLPDLEAAVAEHPLRERLTELAMTALYRAGRQSEALAVCQRLRNQLLDRSGIDPGPPIQALEHKILTHDQSLLPPVAVVVAGAGGGADPVAVAGEGSLVGPVRGAADPGPGADAGPVVGRSRELTVLAGLETVLDQGRSASVLVTGEPGSGKSTLVARMTEGLAGAGAAVVWGRCRAVAHGQVLWPWGQILDGLGRLAGEGDLDGLPGLAALAPSLARSRSEEPVVPPASVAEAAVVFPAVTELLRRISSTRPVVVVLDDAHWADEASIELLAFAGPALARHPVGFVALWRHTEVEPASTRQALRDLARMPAMTRVELEGLPAEAIEELLVTRGPERAALARAVRQVTAGNPFLVRELIAALPSGRPDLWSRGDGSGDPDGGHDELGVVLAADGDVDGDVDADGDAGETEVLAAALLELAPTTNTQELMVHRVEQAHPSALALLTVGALCPRSFPAEVVAEVTGVDLPLVEQALDRVGQAGLLVADEQEGRRYRFVHPVAARALVARVPGPRLARLHAAIGQALWRHGGDPVELAFHLARAGSTGTSLLAARFALQATTRSSRPAVLAQAENLALEGLDLLTPLSGAGGLEIELATFAVHLARLRGDGAGARVLAERALAATTGDVGPDVRALTALAVTGPHPAGPPVTTLAWTGADPDPAWVRQILADAVSATGSEHRWGDVLRLRLDRYQGHARPADHTAGPGHWARWRELALTALDRGTGAERLALAVAALHHPDPDLLVHDRLLAVRLELASAELSPGPDFPAPLPLSARPGSSAPTSIAELDQTLTSVARDLVRGQVAQADAVLELQVAWCRRHGIATGGAIDGQRMWLRWEQGDFAAVADLAGRRGHRAWEAAGAAEAGRLARARELLDVAGGPSGPGTLADDCLLALAAHRCGHRRGAAAGLTALLPWRRSLAVSDAGLVVLGPVSWYAALAAASCDRPALAHELLAEAAEVALRMGAPTWRVRVLAARAELAASARDRARAEQLVAEARSVAADGAAGWLEARLRRTDLQSGSNPFAIR